MTASRPTLWARVTQSAVESALVLLILISISGNASAMGHKPDLTVLVFASGSDPRPVIAPGMQTDLIVSVSNMRGNADAHNVVVTTTLPKGLKFVNSDPKPKRIENGNRFIWEMPAFPAKGLPRLFDVIVEGDAHLAPGSRVEVSADATSDEKTKSQYNHDTYTLFVQQAGPALVFTGSNLDSLPLTPDSPVTFVVELKNAGNLPATDTRMKMSLPPGVKFDKADPPPDSSSGQDFTFKLGDLARDESHSVTVTIELDQQQAMDLQQSGQLLSFNFEVARIVSGREITDSHFQLTKRVEAAGQNVAVWLGAEGAKEPGEASPGDDVTTVITYANLGNKPAHKVVISLALGPGLAIANAEPNPARMHVPVKKPFSWQPTKVVSDVTAWEFEQVGPGLSGSITVHIRSDSLPADGSVLTTTITAGDADLDSSNNSASLLLHQVSLHSRHSIVSAAGGEKHERPSHRFRFMVLVAAICALALLVWRRYASEGASQ